MEIEEFMREAIRQICNSCDIISPARPKKIEFTIQLKEVGQVCNAADLCVSTVNIEIEGD